MTLRNDPHGRMGTYDTRPVRSAPVTTTTARPLYVIAQDIARHWKPVNYAAAPYLDAMTGLQAMTDRYGQDDARTIVIYFLSNAKTWRGEDAKRIKAELRGML